MTTSWEVKDATKQWAAFSLSTKWPVILIFFSHWLNCFLNWCDSLCNLFPILPTQPKLPSVVFLHPSNAEGWGWREKLSDSWSTRACRCFITLPVGQSTELWTGKQAGAVRQRHSCVQTHKCISMYTHICTRTYMPSHICKYTPSEMCSHMHIHCIRKGRPRHSETHRHLGILNLAINPRQIGPINKEKCQFHWFACLTVHLLLFPVCQARLLIILLSLSEEPEPDWIKWVCETRPEYFLAHVL